MSPRVASQEEADAVMESMPVVVRIGLGVNGFAVAAEAGGSLRDAWGGIAKYLAEPSNVEDSLRRSLAGVALHIGREVSSSDLPDEFKCLVLQGLITAAECGLVEESVE